MHIRRRRWLIIAALLCALVVAAAISVAIRIPFSSNVLRDRLVAALEDRLDADVDLQELTLRVYPRVHASGRGLTIRFERRTDVPPLIAIQEFNVDADLIGLWRHRVARVKLDGLAINIPPDHSDSAPDSGRPGAVVGVDAKHEPDVSDAPPDASAYARDVVIEELDAPDSQLTMLRSEPEKPPRIWRMHQLKLRQVGLASKMPFETNLTNAVPPGQISAAGSFGPWSRNDPGATPLDGQFTFDHADLGVFKGISGILSARGSFDGTLDKLTVNGQTETPDFMVNLSGHRVPLRTTYRAIVDATNGNTTLDTVDATVLNTRIVSKGGVYEVEGAHGRVVKLDVNIENGRLDDVMRMAVKTAHPPMIGGLTLSTSLTIPPGPKDIVDKLLLDGRFRINNGRFTDTGVQTKINDMSRRARGKRAANEEPAPKVTSDFAGQFKLGNGSLALSSLNFDIPGAVVTLHGDYSLRRETLAFEGELNMDAKLSQTTGGFKSLLLKIADPIFRRNGKTVVPLKIAGSRNDPKFALDFKRVFNH